MPESSQSRRRFLQAALVAAAAFPGCRTSQPETPLSETENLQAQQTGFSMVQSDEHRFEIRLHANELGSKVETLTISPAGVTATYADGNSQTLPFTPEETYLARASVHVQVADPEREKLKLKVENPENSNSLLTVFLDRKGIPRTPSRHLRYNAFPLECEADISGASHRTSTPFYPSTVISLDARHGGDNRAINLTITGLTPEQEQRVRQKTASRTDSNIVALPGLKLDDNASINLAPVEVRSNSEHILNFRLSDGSTISDAIGKNAYSGRGR